MTLGEYIKLNMDLAGTVVIWDSEYDWESSNSNWKCWNVEEIPEKLLSRNIAGFGVSYTFRDQYVILE